MLIDSQVCPIVWCVLPGDTGEGAVTKGCLKTNKGDPLERSEMKSVGELLHRILD